MEEIKGLININKEANMTSSDVVVKVRYLISKQIGQKIKVGHLGTLDPIGTGVLPIAVGKATRLFDLSQNKIKTYETTFKFGIETNTLDLEGDIINQSRVIPTANEISNVLKTFVGTYDQIPPQFSSKSVNGTRAYKLARKGQTVDLQPKEITIHSFELLKQVAIDEFKFLVSCSSGTYIRSLCRDLANRLNTYAIMTSINRTKSGPFSIENSISINEFEKNPLSFIQPMEKYLIDYDYFEIPEKFIEKVLNGIQIEFDNLPKSTFVVTYKHEIVGIAINDNNKLHFTTRL